MANSARPETGAFAEKMSALMDGPVEFHDCDDVTTLLDGGSDDAGFVQVISGRTDDPERAKGMATDTGDLRAMRPEILGGTLALEPDGTFFQTIYFTDEDSARKGEAIEPPAEVREVLESMSRGDVLRPVEPLVHLGLSRPDSAHELQRLGGRLPAVHGSVLRATRRAVRRPGRRRPG